MDGPYFKDWIQSASGKVVTPLNLRPEQVNIHDIAHALANKCRYTGHTREFMGVGQHCLFGSELIDPKFALTFLLHDASEAYLPDIATPIKPHVHVKRTIPGSVVSETISWKQLEAEHIAVIGHALGIPDLLVGTESAEVKHMDQLMLAWEQRDLLGKPPRPWFPPGYLPAPPARELIVMSPPEAERLYLYRYYQLRNEPHISVRYARVYSTTYVAETDND